MADFTESYTNVQYLGFLALTLVSIFGLMIHLFIIGVNVNDWWKGRSVTPVDHIVTSLGISRMCAQCADIIFLFAEMFFLSSLDAHVWLVIFDAVFDFFNYISAWITTLLSIVFYLKISNLHTRLFLYLRRVIVQRTVYFIVASVFLSACNCFIPLWMTFTMKTKGGTFNTTMDNLLLGCRSIHIIYISTIGDFIPLFFSYISSVLLFTSLYHHTTKMKMSSNLTINLETYYSAMKFVSFIFIYNTLYFIGQFVCSFYYYFYCVTLLWLNIVSGILPVLHSSYLIYRIAKLKNKMSKIIQIAINYFFRKKEMETRENIEIVAQ